MKKMSNHENSRFWLTFALLWTLLVGFSISFNTEPLRWLFYDVNTLQQTSGEVLSSKIEFGGTYGGWGFNIGYRYKVGELEFVSNRVHYGYQAEDDKAYAQSYVDKYPVGKQIVVFYDPNDPGDSVLEPDIKWEGLLPLYIFGVLASIAFFSLSVYYFIKSRR